MSWNDEQGHGERVLRSWAKADARALKAADDLAARCRQVFAGTATMEDVAAALDEYEEARKR